MNPRAVWYTSVLMVLAVGAMGCGGERSGGGGGNTAPEIVEVVGASTELSAGETATVKLRVSDPDLGLTVENDSGDAGNGRDIGGSQADAGAQEAASSLEVSWAVDDASWAVESNGTMAEVEAPERYGARMELSVEVEDPEGATDSTTVRLGTAVNEDPDITELSVSSLPVAPGGDATVSASVTDPNGDDVTIDWSASSNWSLSGDSGDETTVSAPESSGSIGQVRVRASDGYGGVTTRFLQVRTETNRPPVISSLTAAPPQLEPNGTTEVTAEVNDGGDLTYEWTASGDWSVTGNGATAEVVAPAAHASVGTVTVEVTDAFGGSTTGKVVLSTRENRGPNVSTLTADPQSVDRGGTIDLEVTATDPDGGDLSYDWSTTGGTWSVEGSGVSVELVAPEAPGESTRVEVVITDPEGATATVSRVVSTESNQTPVIGSVTANPNPIEPGGSTQLNVNATDPDGDALSYTWSTPSDWSVSDQIADPTLQAPSTFGANVAITVTVTDGYGGQATGTIVASTNDNTDPAIANVTASPTVLEPGGTSTLSVDASDVDGQSLNYSWSNPANWSKSGTGSQIDVTAPDAYGAQATFDVTVSDGTGGSSTGFVTVQTENNDSPIIVSLEADSTTVSPGGTTELTVQAVDPNGDSLSYTWNVPSGWSGSSTSETIEVTAPGSSGESGDIEVVVDDGTDQTTATITVNT